MAAEPGELRHREAIWAARKEILGMVCERLLQFDVPFFLWKGADFAFSLYDNPVERPMADLDILVHEDFGGMASSLLFSAGFRRFSPGPGLFTSGIIGETKFSRGGFLVELHTHPLYHPCILPGKIPPVSSLEPLRRSGGYPAPDWPETFLYTLLHHADSPALTPWQIRDIQLLALKLPGEQWEKLTYLSVKSGWGGRIADVMEKCGVAAPHRTVDVLRHYSYKKEAGTGRGTLYALGRLKGWRKLAFGASVFYRALTGRRPGREG